METDALAMARQLIQKGQNAEALAAVEVALRADASNVEAAILASDLYLKLGKPQFSVQAAMRAAQLDPDNIEAMLKLATAYHRLNDLDKCDRCLNIAVAREPSWMRAQFYQNIKLAGDVDENSLEGHVVLAFDQAAQQPDVSPHVWLNMGRLLFALGAMDAARQAYERAVDLDPDVAEAYACIGEVEFLQNRFAQCLEWFEEARRCRWMQTTTGLLFNRERMAQRIASGDMTLSQVDRYIARALVRQAQFVEANQAMQSALEWQPWDADNVRREFVNEYLATGEVIQEQQGIEAAIEVWESVQGTARQANIYELFLQLGHAYAQAAMRAREKGDRGRMLDWLNRARNLVEAPPVAIPPEAANAWNELRQAVKQAMGRGTGLLNLVR